MEQQLRAVLADTGIATWHPFRHEAQELLHEFQDFRVRTRNRALGLAGNCEELRATVEAGIRAGTISEGNVDAQLLVAQVRGTALALRELAANASNAGPVTDHS